MRREKPVSYDFGDDALRNRPLGECPYCGGIVTIDLLPVNSDFLGFFPRPKGFTTLRVECANGCDLKHFYCPYGGGDSPFLDDALERCLKEWVKVCSALKSPKPCGRCGVSPKWKIEPNSARIECPQCHNGYSDESDYYTVGDLALEWNRNQSKQADAYRLESVLNGRPPHGKGLKNG